MVVSSSLFVADWLLAAEPFLSLQLGDWQFVWRNRRYLLEGASVTILLTAASILLGLLVGFPAGAIEQYGSGRLKMLVRGAGVILRGTPILVIMIFTFFVLPLEPLFVLPVGEAFQAAIAALGLRSAAYQSQIFRGALGSVGDGQLEAARALGLSRIQSITYVAVPQALRRSVPGFQNEFTIVLKDTSIAFAIGLGELLKRSYDLMINQTTAALELFLAISLVYFVLTFTTNRALDALSTYYHIPGTDE